MVTYTPAENKISLFSEDNQFVGDYNIEIIGKFAGTSVSTTDTFKVTITQYCGYASMSVKSSADRDRTIIYQINSGSPSTQTESIYDTYETNDTHCPYTVTQLTHDPATLNLDWQDNSYELGYSYTTSDWIW